METPERKLSLRRIALLAALPLALVGLVVTVLQRSGTSASPQHITASFDGFTNVAPTGRHAMFTLTNTTRGEVALLVEAFEELVSNSWTRTALKGTNRSWLNEWQGTRKNTLKPRESYTFLAPPPVTNAAWRIVFRCFERRRFRDRTSELLVQFTNSAARNDRMFSGRNYQVITSAAPP